MKVVLTETQICYLVLNKQDNNYAVLNENVNFNSLKRKIKHLLLIGVTLAGITMAITKLPVSEVEKEELTHFAKQELLAKQKTEQEQMRLDSISNVKINACQAYMEKALKNQGYNNDSTDLSPQALVKASEKYSFDLPLLMAAAHLESCFGATPRAKRTNSVYSVGAYDNGRDMITYSHPDQSIDGYINLLNNDYLTDGKTIDDLLKPGGFINKNGHRYASKKNYEALLKSVRNKIIAQYPELA